MAKKIAKKSTKKTTKAATKGTKPAAKPARPPMTDYMFTADCTINFVVETRDGEKTAKELAVAFLEKEFKYFLRESDNESGKIKSIKGKALPAAK